MKRFRLVFIALLLFTLTSCKVDEVIVEHYNIILPDLSGLNETEIREVFDNLDHLVTFEYYAEENELESNLFIEYKDYVTGDLINEENELIVVVYPVYTGDPSFITLPDLTGLYKAEIITIFGELGIDISFTYDTDYSQDTPNMFLSYGQFLFSGNSFNVNSTLPIIIYPDFDDNTIYFFPVEMEYDGPMLSEDFEDIDPIDPRGGYFEVTLKYCTDGDTAVFNYPSDIYDAIDSSAKSVRFLNMDTEETYGGNEEEWGKPASVYTCELLTSAETIILQTDPGDNLLGTYGRLLSWVWIKLPSEDDYQLLNYMVVAQGLAQVKYEFGAGETISYGEHTYNEWMHLAEDYAYLNNFGQWGDLYDYYWDYEDDEPNWTRWN